jgi:RNA polymerase sigma-70 factor (ECF subfamily)
VTPQQKSLENLHHIITACIKNDAKSQRQLYGHYYGYALKIVFRYIYRYDKAVDVVNDGFVKLFKNFEKFKCEDDEHIERVLMGWIRRIMINTSIDELRRNNMMPEIGGMPDHVWEQPDKSEGADQKLLYKELIAQVKRLPPAYRAVFNMFVIDGLIHHEVADALGISVGTSKSNLSKARALLQKFIKDREESEICSI